jgi:hypothetical protein
MHLDLGDEGLRDASSPLLGNFVIANVMGSMCLIGMPMTIRTSVRAPT